MLKGCYIMHWFKNHSVRLQIISLVILATIFIAVISGTGYYFNKKATAIIHSMYSEQLRPISILSESRAKMKGEQADMLSALSIQSKEEALALYNKNKGRDESVIRDLGELENYAQSPDERETLVNCKNAWSDMLQAKKQIYELALDGKKEEASAVYKAKIVSNLEKLTSSMWKVGVNHSEIAKQLDEQNQHEAVISNTIILVTALLSLLISICFGLWIARLIDRPIQAVTSALIEVANGNMKIPDVNVESANEIGQLAIALNKMKHEVGGSVRQIRAHAEQVAASSEELTASAEQSAQAAALVAETIAKVAEGAEEQRNEASCASNEVSGMSARIKEITSVAQEITVMADNATEVTSDGKQAVDRVTNQMQLIAVGTETVQQAMNELSSSSAEISDIVGVIGNLASQTNLLALNAAIEAARAGEQGKGFAVVAEEVRKLAEQSQQAAHKIAALIHENEVNVDKAVTAMSEGTMAVSDGITVVGNTGDAFSDIAFSIKQMSDHVLHISASIQEMAGGSERVVSSVYSINALSENAASHTQTVSAATEEQSASMEEIAASSQLLAKMAEELREILHKFSVA